jgi:DNA-binding transcriptional MerR regulator
MAAPAHGPRTTSAVARSLDIAFHKLFYLIRAGKLTAPKKLDSGDYYWTAADISRAKKVLAGEARARQGLCHGGRR